jgi:hypothetical protein
MDEAPGRPFELVWAGTTRDQVEALAARAFDAGIHRRLAEELRAIEE